jgi:Uma2 family endonuclease
MEDRMSTQTVHLPLLGTMAGFRRFSVAEYHKLIDIGLLTENDNLELIEGYLVHKMSRNPPHDSCIHLTLRMLLRCLPPAWSLRMQSAITLSDSEPEPDLAVVCGDERTYAARHPLPADVGLVIEVADSTLLGDRADKGRIYARAGLAVYWIINLIDRQVEVYSSPLSSGPSPAYGQRIDYGAGDQVPLILDGALMANILVRDLLP